MMTSKQDAFVGVAVLLLAVCIGYLVVLKVEEVRAIKAQDVVCYSESGDQILFAQNIAVVSSGPSRIVLEFPDGRPRVFVSGSCEYAPHDPDGDYKSEDIQSWKGDPEDRWPRNA